MTLLLGCIADDITGASDMGLMLARNGMPASLFLGVPKADWRVSTPAVVIALKIRTVAAEAAVAEATLAANRLLSKQARQLFYKYCSTFDSTANGNIGPVSDALLKLTGEAQTVLLPAFPANGRTVRDGSLYVNGVPLAESSMREHPLTPMTESFLPSLMDAQTKAGQSASIGLETVEAGPEAIGAALDAERNQGKRYVSIDTVDDEHLNTIAAALVDRRFITGGSGIGGALPDALRNAGLLGREESPRGMPALPGHAAVIAGSCSAATRQQVALFEQRAASFVLDPALLYNDPYAGEALADAAVAASAESDVLVYSTTEPGELRKTQQALGVMKSAELIETALARVARRLWDAGVRKFAVAGGETSGAVATALGIQEFRVGQEIDPGVPWLVADRPQPACFAFKSGNFGRTNFFQHALDLLP
ncbi:MAG: 3-oxo-tetronate kinase [Pseudomonadota bacterium]